MRTGAFALIAILFLLSGCVQNQEAAQPNDETAGGELLKLLSKDLKHGQEMPAEFTCDGLGISPELHWEQAPSEAKSFALVVSDPDAPAGTFYHWLVCNIPISASSIQKGGPLPLGAIEVENDYGQLSYGPPCPPSGTHRYLFKLYALDTEKIGCNNKQQFLQQIEAHKLEKAELLAPYMRK